MKKISLKMGLILAFGILISIPIVVSSVFNYRNVTATMSQKIEQSSISLISEIDNEISNYFNIYSNGAILLSQDDYIANLPNTSTDKLQIYEELSKYLAVYKDAVRIYIGYEDQTVITFPQTELPSDYDLNSQKWYTDSEELGTLVLSDPFIDYNAQGESVLVTSTSVPIFSHGKHIGVIAVEIELSKIANILTHIQVGKEGYPVLFTNEGITVTHKNADLVGKLVPVPELADFIANNASGIFEYTYNAVDKVSILTTMAESGWKILVTLPQEELVSDAKKVVSTTLFIGSMLLVIALIFAFVFSTFINRSIQKVIHRVNFLKDGDFTAKNNQFVFEEFTQLSDIIENMTLNVSELI